MIITSLIGDPVKHSVSPFLFEEFANVSGIKYSHILLRIKCSTEENLIKALDAIKTLNFAGFNVTLPYKVTIIKYLDNLDKSADNIGAVNTVVNMNGHLVGYNTDGLGAMRAIDSSLEPISEKDNVVILGAGGAARAILYEISKKTKKITVFNRSKERLDSLKLDFNSKGIAFEKFLLIDEKTLINKLSTADYIINATSVGMTPNQEKSLLSKKILDKVEFFGQKKIFDAIFNPHKTKLLQEMESIYGCKVLGGLEMMIYQGLEAFRLWTGYDVSKKVNVKEIEQKLIKKINE